MKRVYYLGISCLLLIASGCASVTVTKTAKGYFPPTDPDEVEILVTVPQDRGFIELATVTTQKWSTSATAKMHNSFLTSTLGHPVNTAVRRAFVVRSSFSTKYVVPPDHLAIQNVAHTSFGLVQ